MPWPPGTAGSGPSTTAPPVGWATATGPGGGWAGTNMWGSPPPLNLLFGLRLRYYNGTVVHRRENLLGLPPPAHGFAYQAEALVRLVKAGHSYIEVGTPIQKREHGSSKLFAWRNLLSVARALFHLFLEVRVWERNKYQRGAYPALP